MAHQATTTSPRPSHATDATLPSGWRHAAPVQWLLDHPVERREAILAGAFGVLAAIWAPLGILAFLARVFSVFLVVSLLLVVVLAAPRPTAVAQLTAALRTHVAPAARRIGPALGDAGRQLGAAMTHVRRELPGVVAAVRAEMAPLGRRLSRAGSSTMARVRRGAAHTRERLAELGPSPAQSRPRSAR